MDIGILATIGAAVKFAKDMGDVADAGAKIQELVAKFRGGAVKDPVTKKHRLNIWRGFNRNDSHIGRSWELAELCCFLTASKGAILIGSKQAKANQAATVIGRGGVGKSTLAWAYQDAYQSKYDGGVFIVADSEAKIIEGLAGFARALGFPQGVAFNKDDAQAFLDTLGQSGGQFLVVYDNVETRAAFRDLEPPTSSNIHLIVTTRNRNGWAGFETMDIGALPHDTVDDAGPQLLIERSGIADDPENALALTKTLEGLPLALVHAGGFVRSQQINFETYHADYLGYLDDVPDPEDDTDKSIVASVQMSIEKLSNDAQMILNIIAHLGPLGLGPWVFQGVRQAEYWDAVKNELPAQLVDLVSNDIALRKAFAQLNAQCLIEPDRNDSWSLHRMTATAVRVMQDGVWAGSATLLLRSNLTGNPNTSENWGPLRRVTPHLQAMLAHGGLPDTAEASYLLADCGIYLSKQHRFAERLILAEEDWRRAQDHYEPDQIDHPNYAAALGNLGVAKSESGDLSGAVTDLERRLAMELDHRPRSAVHGIALNQLSDVLLEQGAADTIQRAIEMCTERIAIMQDLVEQDPDDPQLKRDLIQAINNLGAAHSISGDPHTALEHVSRAVDLSRGFLPANDYGLLVRAGNLGGKYLELGQFQTAFPLVEEGFLGLQTLFFDAPRHRELRENAESQITSLWIQHRLAQDDSGHRLKEARRIADQYELDWDERQDIALLFYITGLRRQGGTALADAAARDLDVADMARKVDFAKMVKNDPILSALNQEANEKGDVDADWQARVAARLAALRAPPTPAPDADPETGA